MSEEPEYRSRETITLATACSYALVRAAFLFAEPGSAGTWLGRVALLLLVELPLVTLAVALLVNGLVLHVLGGRLRGRLGRRKAAADDAPAARLKPWPSGGETPAREPDREG